MTKSQKIEAISAIARLTESRIKRAGGGRIAQESGVIYAKALFKEGAISGASCIDAGFKAGKKMMVRINYKQNSLVIV